MKSKPTPNIRPPGRCALALIGALYIIQGIIVGFDGGGWMMDEDALLYEMIPTPARVAMWAITGGITLAFAFAPRLHPIAWAVATIMPVERAFAWAWSYLMWLIPGDPRGVEFAWAQALQWVTWIGLLWILATDPTFRGAQRHAEREETGH